MSNSYPFPTYSGLLEPKHYKNIGSAIWLFLWCISSTTKEVERDGVMWGIVLGNKPVKREELSEQFGVDEKTIRRWIKTLEQHEYIRVKRVPYGMIFTVKNSKKFRNGVDKNVHSPTQSGGENAHSLSTEWTETPTLLDKNVHSNKDITEINNAATTITDQKEILRRAHEVEKYFLAKRGKATAVSVKDFEEIKQLVATGIPLEVVKHSIDKTFAEYKPKHSKDEIRNVSYCIPRCYDEWARMQVTNSITSPVVPSTGSVALGASRVREFRNRLAIQNEIAIRKIMEAEERERNGSAEIIFDYPKLV